MNFKLILFFSIIMLILSAGAVSSADVNQIDVVDSSEFEDESLDVDDSGSDLSGSGSENDDGEMPKMELPRDYDKKSDDNSSDNGSDRQENKDTVPDVICEASNLDGLNLYVSVMDNSGTDSGEALRERVAVMYQTDIPKVHSNTLVLKNNIETIDKKLIIKITSGKDITIDGQGNTIDLKGSSKHDHYFVVKSGNIIFKNINFINGYNKDGDNGGAISFEGNAKGRIVNCTFENCWAEEHGGAIADRTGNKLTVINSSFIGNFAGDDGGAIHSKGSLYLDGCTFENNNASDCSGAVDVEGSTAEICKCHFIRNHAKDDGGAIWIKGNLILNNSYFMGNVAEDCRGAVDVEGSTAEIYPCAFFNNSANDDGGAIWANGNLIVNSSSFMGNVADDSAGTIYAGKDLSLINFTVYPNIIKDDKPIVGKGKVKIIDSSLPGNLYCLQLLIDSAKEGSTLNLNSNYATIKDKLIIIINKSIVIDGHGHTIDLAGDSKHDHYFKVTDGSVTFKNIRFINGFNKDDDKGGAIFFKSLKKM